MGRGSLQSTESGGRGEISAYLPPPRSTDNWPRRKEEPDLQAGPAVALSDSDYRDQQGRPRQAQDFRATATFMSNGPGANPRSVRNA